MMMLKIGLIAAAGACFAMGMALLVESVRAWDNGERGLVAGGVAFLRAAWEDAKAPPYVDPGSDGGIVQADRARPVPTVDRGGLHPACQAEVLALRALEEGKTIGMGTSDVATEATIRALLRH